MNGAGGSPLAEVKPGDRLPDLVRTIELTDMVAYGAATWDWHRLHYDTDYAQRAGMDRPVVDGQMLGAFLAEQVIRWLDGHGRLNRLHFRNRAPVLQGDTVTCQATVIEVGPTGVRLEHMILVGDHIVVAPAGTEIAI